MYWFGRWAGGFETFVFLLELGVLPVPEETNDLWHRAVWHFVLGSTKLGTVKGDCIFKTRHIPGYNRRTSAAIVRAPDELAFRKWRLKQQGQDVNQDSLVASWRDTLGHLRDRQETIAG